MWTCLWVGLAVAEQQAPPHPAAHARAHLRRHTCIGNSEQSQQEATEATSQTARDDLSGGRLKEEGRLFVIRRGSRAGAYVVGHVVDEADEAARRQRQPLYPQRLTRQRVPLRAEPL